MACIAIDAGFVVAMTIDAERHVVKLKSRSDLCHRGNVPMTGGTIDSLCDVGLVIEKHEIRDTVHLHPSDGFLCFPGLADLHDLGLRRAGKLMTTHARLHRRNDGSRGLSRAAVTILACDLILAGMNDMAEGYGLARTCVLPCTAGRNQKSGQSNEKEAIHELNAHHVSS